MKRVPHFLSEEPTGGTYRRLVDLSLVYCDRSLLVVHDMPLDPSGTRVLQSLEPFLREASRRERWPGTELFGGVTATVYYYSLCSESAVVLKEAADGLYSWQQPERPEDLCFLRPDGTPWLVSIAHEAESYFEMSPEEKDQLLAELPELGLLVVGDPT